MPQGTYKIILIIRIEDYRKLNTDMLQLTKVYKQNKIIYKWASISYDHHFKIKIQDRII